MARTNCPACGASVQVARVSDKSKMVTLEVHTDASADTDRYKIVGHRPLRVIKVATGAYGDYFPDHQFDCPGANAGRS